MRAEEFLPDEKNHGDINGVTVRKGTVGAFLANARAWSDPSTPEGQLPILEADIVEAIPALQALGLFDVMTIRDERFRKLVDANTERA